MSARNVIEAALTVYFATSRNPQAMTETTLTHYDALVRGDGLVPDFFRPLHTYRRSSVHGGTWVFQVLEVGPDPDGVFQAVGWLARTDTARLVWHVAPKDQRAWATREWVDTTEAVTR